MQPNMNEIVSGWIHQKELTNLAIEFLSFVDTGGGILEEDLTKLFEPLVNTKVKRIELGLDIKKNFRISSRITIPTEKLDNSSLFYREWFFSFYILIEMAT